MRAALFTVSVVGVMLAGTVEAFAQPRVGVANVSAEPSSQTDVANLRAVARARGYQVLGPGPARAALEEALEPADDRAAGLREVEGHLTAAQAAAEQFDYKLAGAHLDEAEDLVLASPPGARATGALVALNLRRGVLAVERGDARLAAQWFALVKRLAPELAALDPAEFRPEAVAAYAASGASGGRAAGLKLATQPAGAAVWIDGQRRQSTTPTAVADLPAGEHYVVTSLPGHTPRGQRIRFEGGRTRSLSLLLPRLPPRSFARATRRHLLEAAGPTGSAWTQSAAALADLASVDLLVLVRRDDSGSIAVAVYDRRADRISGWSGSLADVLPAYQHPAVSQAPIEKPKPWYRTGVGIGAIVGGAALLGAGIYFWATAPDDTYAIDTWCVNGEC